MKIRVVVPIITRDYLHHTEAEFRAFIRDDDEFSMTSVERGPASIESNYDAALALPDMLKLIEKAEEEGVDAVIINCVADPGLEAARELASIPVIGMGQASFQLASILAHNFSVVSILERDIPDIDRLCRLYGVLDKLASVRVLNIPVLDLRSGEVQVSEAVTKAALQAVREDGAGAVVFGCGGLSAYVEDISQEILRNGYNIPVISPAGAAMKLAQSLVDMKLLHSKVTYPDPPSKEIIYP